jgi:hypothetical protein
VKRAALALLVWAGLLLPGGLFAHGVEVEDLSGSAGPAPLTVHFTYSTGEPMMFAKIRLFAPSRPDTEVLSSLADRNGRFSFVPDEEGEWIVEASDNMGHQGSITVTGGGPVDEGAGEAGPPAGSGGKTPLVMRLILGLSLILNIFAVYYVVLIRFPKKRDLHAYQ